MDAGSVVAAVLPDLGLAEHGVGEAWEAEHVVGCVAAIRVPSEALDQPNPPTHPGQVKRVGEPPVTFWRGTLRCRQRFVSRA